MHVCIFCNVFSCLGGLAEKTRALQIGDQLLAIDGHTIEKQPLSRAITLLQQSGENVILKVSRAAHSQ